MPLMFFFNCSFTRPKIRPAGTIPLDWRPLACSEVGCRLLLRVRSESDSVPRGLFPLKQPPPPPPPPILLLSETACCFSSHEDLLSKVTRPLEALVRVYRQCCQHFPTFSSRFEHKIPRFG
jgi:hypothetical protein